MPSEPLSVLLVPFPELAEVVEPWLERSSVTRPSQGIPPHVTLLFPCPADAPAIRDVLEPVAAFDVEFRELRRFDPDIAYLAPEPAKPFLRATEALAERFPDWPPYGGVHQTVVPHLTVVVGRHREEAEAAVAPALPLRAGARGAVLLSQVGPERWEPQARFAFRGA